MVKSSVSKKYLAKNRFIYNLEKLCTFCNITKIQGWEFNHRFFNQINRFLWMKDRKIHSIKKKIESLLLIFLKDQLDRFAHGRSFLKNDRIDSLIVDLFQRSTRSICSRSLFLKERQDLSTRSFSSKKRRIYLNMI